MSLTAEDVELLAEAGRVEAVSRRGIVPLDGATLAIVMDGYFRVFRNAAFVRDVTIGLASRGDVLAPAVAFGDPPAESGAEALSAGHILLLSPETWRRRAAADPGLSLKFAASVGRRLNRVQQKLEQYSRSSVEARVAATLLELGADYGTPLGAGGVRLDLPLAQDDLARLAGTTRETTSSLVAEFGRRGFVRGGRLRGLVLCDLPGLEALAAAGF